MRQARGSTPAQTGSLVGTRGSAASRAIGIGLAVLDDGKALADAGLARLYPVAGLTPCNRLDRCAGTFGLRHRREKTEEQK